MHGFISNFLVVISPGPYAQTFFILFYFIFVLFFIWILFNEFLFVFVNMGHSGSENVKTLLLLQIAAKSFQTCPQFSSQWSSQNYVVYFWNLDFPIFNDFFPKISNSLLYPMEKSKSWIICKTSDRRVKRSEIWDSQVVFLYIWGSFGLVACKVIWGHSMHLQFFPKYDFQTILLLQITTKIYQNSPELSSQ